MGLLIVLNLVAVLVVLAFCLSGREGFDGS